MLLLAEMEACAHPESGLCRLCRGCCSRRTSHRQRRPSAPPDCRQCSFTSRSAVTAPHCRHSTCVLGPFYKSSRVILDAPATQQRPNRMGKDERRSVCDRYSKWCTCLLLKVWRTGEYIQQQGRLQKAPSPKAGLLISTSVCHSLQLLSTCMREGLCCRVKVKMFVSISSFYWGQGRGDALTWRACTAGCEGLARMSQACMLPSWAPDHSCMP